MKCKACKKEMKFLEALERTTSLIIPAEERMEVLDKHLVVCEFCYQPYGYVNRKGKPTLITMTKRWLAKQPEDEQKRIAQSVEHLRKQLKQAELVKEWVKKLSMPEEGTR
jgi:predicted GTPase